MSIPLTFHATGNLLGVGPRVDGGRTGTLITPEVAVFVIFPPATVTDLVATGNQVTVAGTRTSNTVYVQDVQAGTR